MTLTFDVFWSFRSPYCYLSLDRLLVMRRDFDVEIAVRPVYPLAVRQPDFFERVNPLYRSYQALDTKRLAQYLGMPFRRPVPDPIVQDPQTGAIAPEQPYIYRLTRLGVAAALEERGLEFLDRVSRMLWDATVDDWHEGTHLADAMRRAGLDPDALAGRVEREPERLDEVIEENQRAHQAAGHWGVPTFVFEGEPFYGQDRLELLTWRMRQKGLQPRGVA